MKPVKPNQTARGMIGSPATVKPIEAGLEPIVILELVIQDIHQRADHVGPLLKGILQVGHGKSP